MKINPAVIGFFGYYFYRFLTATLRFKEEGRKELDEFHEQGERLVFCLWHNELFSLMKMQRQFDIVTLVSASRDGEILAAVLERLGLRTVRGSSSRKGMSALLGAAHLMKENHIHGCITVDGPRGPRHEVKSGALFLAFHAKAYVVPVRIRIAHKFTFSSWDKFELPFPFSAVTITYETPWKIEETNLTSEVLESNRLILQNILNASD